MADGNPRIDYSFQLLWRSLCFFFFPLFFFCFVSVFLVEFASGVSSRVCDCLSEVLFVSCVVELGTAAPMRSFAQAASTEEVVVPSRVVQIDGLVCVLFYILALGLGFPRDEVFRANDDEGGKTFVSF
jgi:hypothetical protein